MTELADAAEANLEGVVGIYNEVIANTTAVFANLPVTVDERRRWWQSRTAQGYPVLIARDERGVAGIGSFGDFRAWPGYRFTVEHTLHVRADARGRRQRHANAARAHRPRTRARQTRHDR